MLHMGYDGMLRIGGYAFALGQTRGDAFALGQTRDSGLVDRDFSIRVMRSSIFALSRRARFARRTKSPELSR